MRNKKKSKYIAPNIQVDAIATEHWIAANSEEAQESTASKPIKSEKSKDQDSNDDKSW